MKKGGNMEQFKAIFTLEGKRFLQRRNLVLFAVIVLLSLYFTWNGISRYRETVEKSQEFRQVESEMFKKMLNYYDYGRYGVNIIFMAGANNVLFGYSNFMSETTAKVDSIVGLKLESDLKSKQIFDDDYLNSFGFSGLIFFLLSLLVLFYGYESLRHRSYLRCLASLVPYRKLFGIMILSRVILLVLGLVFLFALVIGFSLLNGMPFLPGDYAVLAGFLLAAIGMLLFFFLAGVLIGLMSPGSSGKTLALGAWLLVIFVVPAIINTFSASPGEFPSIYRMELEKLRLLDSFERRAFEKTVNNLIQTDIDLERKLMEEYWNKDYREIEALEKSLRDRIQIDIVRYQRIAVVSPASFFNLAAHEASSRGYESFTRLYTYTIDLKKKFIRFYIDRMFYNDPQVLVNFVQHDENLFYGQSSLPANFMTGLALTLAYSLVLLWVSFYRFKKSLYGLSGQAVRQLKQVDKTFKMGDLSVWRVDETNLCDLFYNLLSGKNEMLSGQDTPVRVMIDKADICREKNREPFIYLSEPEDIPGDMTVKDFIVCWALLLGASKEERNRLLHDPRIEPLKAGRLHRLTPRQRREVILAITYMPRPNIYLIDNIATGMPVDYAIAFKERLEALAQAGALVIYLTTNDCSVSEKIGSEPYFYESSYWTGMIEHRKSLLASQKEKKP